MALPSIGIEAAFEIHLPQFVGRGAFKALEGGMLGRLLWSDQVVAMQNAGDGAWRRDLRTTLVLEHSPQFASAPARPLLTQCDHALFDCAWRLSWRNTRPTRTIG